MAKNKTTIKIVNIIDKGRNQDIFCNTVLMLRKARKPGDIEVVNNTVLGKLRQHPSYVEFEIVEE